MRKIDSSVILGIETAGKYASVCVALGGEIRFVRESREKNSHSAVLATFIAEALEFIKSRNIELSTVAVSKGPGSYTGLRIGVSSAKGICYANDIPLIGVNTLSSMAGILASEKNEDAVYCPMLDARRMEVYCGLYSRSGDVIEKVDALIIDEQTFSSYNEGKAFYYFGDGADKCSALFSDRKNFHFVDEIHPHASGLIEPAMQAIQNEEFENLAYFEPYYLKDFVAGKPRVKGLYD